jgi:TetR/AcrR family transcriptional regulator
MVTPSDPPVGTGRRNRSPASCGLCVQEVAGRSALARVSTYLLAFRPVPRAPSIPAAERRAHAVRALLELAYATSPDQISTAAIAERMGVSHAALFRHFPSREALWAEAVHWATAELDRRFQAVDQQGLDDPLAEIEALLIAHGAFLQANPGLLRMFFAELQRPETSPARDVGKAFLHRFRKRLAGLISTAQQQGLLGSPPAATELAEMLVALCQGLMLQALVHGTLDGLAERTRRGLALVLRS